MKHFEFFWLFLNIFGKNYTKKLRENKEKYTEIIKKPTKELSSTVPDPVNNDIFGNLLRISNQSNAQT